MLKNINLNIAGSYMSEIYINFSYSDEAVRNLNSCKRNLSSTLKIYLSRKYNRINNVKYI